MLWLTYARVSREEQARLGYSLPAQVEACGRRARELGATRVVSFTDEGVPGDVLDRPGLTRLREAAAGGAAGVVVYDPDRLARNLSHQLLLTESFERAGVRLEFVNFEWQDTPEGKLFYAIRGAIAEYEKEKIRERTMRGRRQKARAGRLPGHPHTYGYTFDPVTDTLAVHPQQAAVVRLMFTWVAREHLSPRQVARRLNQMRIPPARAGRWWPQTVHRMLCNSTYAGTHYVHRYDFGGVHKNRFRPADQRVSIRQRPRDQWIPIPVPAIIDPATWSAVQEQVTGAGRRWRAQARGAYLLTGLTRCGLCGRPVSGTASRGHRYYRCVGYMYRPPGGGTCGLPTHRAGPVEAGVWAAIVRWLHGQLRAEQRRAGDRAYRPAGAPGRVLGRGPERGSVGAPLGAPGRAPGRLPGRAPMGAPGAPDGQPQAVAGPAAERAAVEATLAALARERGRLITLFQRDLVPEAEATARLAELQAREETLQNRRAALSAATPVAPPALPEPAAAASRVRGALARLRDPARRRFLHRIVQAVVFYPDHIEVRVKGPPPEP